ncbi:MAG: histidine kinase [Ilumatobacteraceae bacterium]
MGCEVILWADAPLDGDGYVRPVQIARAVQRDVRAHRADYALAAAMVTTAIIFLAIGVDADQTHPNTGPGWAVVTWVATIGACLTLIGRRRWPLQCFAVAVALLVVVGLGGASDNVGYLVMLIGLYSAAESLPLRRASAAIVMLVGLVVVSRFVLDNDPTTGLVGAAAAFALGRLIRGRRRRQDDEAAAARRRARAAIDVANLDAAEDRQRVAQELHDVVAHSLSVIAVRAGIGAHLIDREPDEAARALDAIRATSSAATLELGRLIVLLRDGDSTTTEPPPVLANIDALCAQVADTGVAIELVVDGNVDGVASGVSLAAYRIVQEALTNVVRHAGPATARVRVRVSAAEVEIDVEDDGSGTSASAEPERSGTGRGLVGMSERAQMYGGALDAGPRAGGGFRVHAVLRPSGDAVAVLDERTPDADAQPDQSVDSNPGRRRIPMLVWDIGLALTFAGFAARELIAGRSTDGVANGTVGFAAADGLAWALKIGCCLALAGRRRCPATSLLFVSVLAAAVTVGDYESGVVVFVWIVGFYSVGSYATTARFVAAMLGIPIVMGVVDWSNPPDLTGTGAIWTGTVAAAAALTGYVVRRERDGRDARIAEHHAEGIDESRRSRLAATTERLGVAEELDRVISRSIDSISTAANSGYELTRTDPAAARELLEVISTTSRDALGELRRVLKRLHADGETAPHAPAPAIAETHSQASA